MTKERLALQKRLMERLDKTEEELMYLTQHYPNMLMSLSDEALRQVSVPLLKGIQKIKEGRSND